MVPITMKDKILNAAEKRMVKFGYRKVTMDEIAKDLKWRNKQKVEVKRVARGVKITDARSKKRKVKI